jgi:hypothetical protein
MKRSILMLLLLCASLAGHAVETPKHVFIKASCNGTIPAAMLAAFREEIRASNG